MFGLQRVVSRVHTLPKGLVNVRALSTTDYKNIKTEVRGKVGVITLHRPKALNALCDELIGEVLQAGKEFDQDANIGAIVITGMFLLSSWKHLII